MKRFVRGRGVVVVLLLASFVGRAAAPAYGKSPVKIRDFEGTIDLSVEGPIPFTLKGTASHLGRYEAYGEVEFVPGEEEGSLVGEGVVVFEAANGDLLVGVVEWDVEPGDGEFKPSALHLSWRDAVQFGDGTVVTSTGRFVKDRPPGLVVIAIIAILLHLMLPSIQ